MKKIIFLILFLGIVYRLFISANGNFIFNMDNARDMIDVREMVVLGKMRLIGPTTSIDGVYFGPFWYYMLAIPFVLTGGNPYGSIVLEILLWAVGGYFLLSLVYKYYGKLSLFAVSLLWLASNFIVLGTQYAFNPNPVLFLTPVFIFSLLKYIETQRPLFLYFSWFLAGAFFHFIVPVGIFMPAIIILAIFLTNRNLLMRKEQLIGLAFFVITFLPQIIFDLRHNFFMTKSLFEYRSIAHGSASAMPDAKFRTIFKSFYETLLPTFMNFKIFTNAVLVAFGGICIYFVRIRKMPDKLTLICLSLLFVNLFGLQPIKIEILRWYLNASLVAALILVGFIISTLEKKRFSWMAYILVVSLFVFTLQNVSEYIHVAIEGNPGNSIFKNEIAAVDLVYQKASGKNFKVYSYLPSVYDFPYQYLFWWHGLKTYGYLPEDYAYLPNKPQYVAGKEKLIGGLHPESSGLVFLIKEPDQIGQRHLWENTFKDLELLETDQIGAITIEIRKEISQF